MITNRLPAASTATPRSTPDRAAADPTVSPTDGELLMRFTRHGDRDAFAQVVERHRPMVWGVCSRVLVRHADAEDAYQATLLILAKKAGSIRANDSAGGWLFRVAHNAALQSRRRRKALRETSLEESPPAPEPLFPDIQQRELFGVLLEELRALPTKYQTPLVLRYLEGKSRQEIATAIDATAATVAGRLVRGRRLLRSRLARRGVSLAVVLGAVGIGTSSQAAGTIHAAPPTFSPTLLTAGVPATVSTLVNQGIRSMLYASYAKPTACGLAAAIAAIALVNAPRAGTAQTTGEAPVVLAAGVPEGEQPAAPADGATAQLSTEQSSELPNFLNAPSQPPQLNKPPVPPAAPAPPGLASSSPTEVDQALVDRLRMEVDVLRRELETKDARSVAIGRELKTRFEQAARAEQGSPDFAEPKATPPKSDDEPIDIFAPAAPGQVNAPSLDSAQDPSRKINAVFVPGPAHAPDAFDGLKKHYARIAVVETTLDLSQPSFEELYWQANHWRNTEEAVRRELTETNQQLQVLSQLIAKGERPRDDYLPVQRRIGELRAELPMAKGKLAEFERLMKLAALRETQPKAPQRPQPVSNRREYFDPPPAPARLPEVPSAILGPGDTVLVDSTLDKDLGVANKRCLVEADGTIGLGAAIGRVKVSGLTMRQAEKAVQDHIDKAWEDTQVQLTPVEVKVPTYAPPASPFNPPPAKPLPNQGFMVPRSMIEVE